MYIYVKKRQDLIDVPDSFMSLSNVTDEKIIGSVKYSFNQVSFIQRLSSAGSVVRITFSIKNPKQEDPIKAVNPQLNPELVPAAVQGLYRAGVEFAKTIEKASIVQITADSTSKVNNQLITAIRQARGTGFNATQLRSSQYTLQTVKQATEKGEDAPILHATSLVKNDSITFEPSSGLKALITSEQKDPSSVVNQTIPQVSPHQAIQGTSGRVPYESEVSSYLKNIARTDLTEAASSTLFPGDRKILVIESVADSDVEVKKNFQIFLSDVRNQDGTFKPLFVFFEVLDAGGVITQKVEKTVDISKILEVFRIPKIPPIINVYKNGKSLIGSIRVQQMDPQAKFINLYQKFVSHVSNDAGEYFFIDSFDLNFEDGERIVPVEVPAASTIIYRAIPVGANNLQSFEFTNIVMTSNAKDRNFRYASLGYTITGNGVELEIREVTFEAVSFDVIRKDRTIFDSSYSVVTSSPIMVDSGQTQYQVVDSSVKNNHVYEYVVRLNLKDGRSKLAGSIVLEFVPFADGIVDTQIKNLAVTFHPDPNVTFDLETNVVSSNLDTITNLLREANLLDFFSADILNERDKLNDLVCYNITRQDLTIGAIEDFGIISQKSFSDETSRVVNSVSPLKTGHQYRYTVSTLLRSPETLFEDFTKTAIDPVTSKTYTYKPFKFFQPIALERGTLSTAKALHLNHPQEAFAFGNVGSFTSAEVTFDRSRAVVSDTKAELIFDDFISVRWKYDGVLNDVDHFILMRENQGRRDVIGKAHALAGTKTFQFIRKKTMDDTGELEFVVRPVFIDYQLGAESVSNRLIIS